MKSIKKRAVSALTVLALLLGLCTPLGGLIPAAEAAGGTYGVLSYSVIDNPFNNEYSSVYCTINGCDTSASGAITIPDSIDGIPVERIGTRAFYNCNDITSLYIPDSVITMNLSAIVSCAALSSIQFSENLTSIVGAIDCPSLTSVTIPQGVAGVDFSDCTGLTSIVIPEGVTEVDGFSGCTSLTYVSLPSTTEVIGQSAFQNCTSLKSITLPEGLRSIRGYAFQNCTSLTSIVIPSTAEYLWRDSLSNFDWGHAFDGCTSLSKVAILSRDVVLESSYALESMYTPYYSDQFENCADDLTLYGYPGSTTEAYANYSWNNFSFSPIDDSFSGFPGGGDSAQPSSGTIPTPVLDKAEFANKAVTVTWTLPLTVPGQTHTVDSFNILRKSGSGSSYQKIATVSGSSGGSYTDRAVIIGATYTYTVQACYQGKTGSYNAEGLTVKAEDPPGVSDDLSYEIVNGKAVITDCRETAVSVAIPAELEGCPVVMIDSSAFRDCKKLTSVTLPDCLTVVGDYAFYNCSSLTSIDLTHVISIGQQAFAWCSDLTDIRCGPDLASLGEHALEGWTSLLTVTGYVRTPAELQCSMEGVKFRYIPSDVDKIARGTFEYPDANGDTASCSFYYNDDFFSYDNSAYHSDLAVMTLKLAMAGYSRQNLYTEDLPEHDLRRALNLQRLFSDMGFGNAEFSGYNTALTDTSSKVAYGFASRQIGQDVVVAVVLRGGGYGGEWADNFNVGTSGDHAGFSAAAKAVQAELEDYIAGLKDLYQFSGEVKLWMTGYSRSGATCNLLAQAMSSRIDSDNLYAYVFAAPNCTTAPKACRGLFSIISAADLVPCVPLSKWGFGRHGTTLTFPSVLPEVRKDEFEELSGIDLDDDESVTYVAQPAAVQQLISTLGLAVDSRSAYNSRYSDLIQQSLRAYYGTKEPVYSAGETLANGLSISALLTLLPVNAPALFMLSAIGRAHQPAHYLAWLEAGTLHSIGDFDASGKMVSFASNANVQIKNSKDEIIATIRNGAVTSTGTLSGIQVESVEGQTSILLTDGRYTLEVYGSGTADISILEFSSSSAVRREVVFSGVALKSEVMALEVSAGSSQEEYRLEDGNKIIRPTSDTASDASASSEFQDVLPGSWYYDAVQWAVENGVTSGTSASTFSPDRPCTRAEVVTLLWRALGLDELTSRSTENPFRDVDTGAFYCDAVLWAAENGITTGSSATTFSPNAVCTRAEVVTFLWRTDYPPKKLSGPVGFSDVELDDFFWFPVKWALEEGITTGTSAATFSPLLTCTRAQVVTFLYRYFSN